MLAQRKTTIAVLIDHIDQLSRGYESQLRSGFMRVCAELDLNLLMVAGRALRAPDARGTSQNGVYDLMHPECVDGLILMSNSIIGSCGLEGLRDVCRGYAPLPLCSAGLAIPGVPSVLIDNRPGMDDLVEHLIREHGRREIVLLAGPKENPDARLRFEVYREVLGRHGLAFDPCRVAIGSLTTHGGRKAMAEVLARGGAFDAVVAASDGMAMGASDVLREHGRACGRELSLVGFDDLALARLVHPPLTTVRQPLDEMASLAVRLLVEQMEGRPVPILTSLPAQLTMRQSCGCTPSQRSPGRAPSVTSAGEFLEAERPRILAALEKATRLPRDERVHAAPVLLDGLQAELGGQARSLLAGVERVADWIEQSEEQYEELQKAISLLRSEFRAFSRPELEDLWDDARCSIAFANTRRQAHRLLDVDLTYRHLLTTSERFSSTLDLGDLRRCVADELREMAVQNAVICLYLEEDESRLSPFLCLRDGELYDPEVVDYPATRLFPPGAWSSPVRRTSFVLPLSADGKQIGVAAFEFTPGLRVHDMLCEQIGGAIQTARLHRQIVQKTKLHERALQERRAAAQRMDSLSVLAGGVAHDLNNALGPLLALPSIMAGELAGATSSGSHDADQLRADLTAIQSAALRASHIITDLLTLGRQGRTERHPIDLNQAICSWQAIPPSALSQERARLEVELALDGLPLVIEASEAHVIRALCNLVSNAVESIDGQGLVKVETRREVLTKTHVGYERVPPGNYAILRVSDTGKGIARDLFGRLFEPFVTTKRITGSSGTGLGLAVVHGVVKEHAGFIDVKSEPGRGTAFSLYFPLSAEVARRVAPISTPPRGSGRILVVDDDPVQLTTARRVLGHLGYDVSTLPSGQKALELFAGFRPSLPSSVSARESPFDIIMMDMMLNEMSDGLDLIEIILELFPMQRAIITSGHAPDARVDLAIARGIGWLTKPYTVNALAKALQGQIAADTDRFEPQPAVHHSFTAMLRTGRGSPVRSKAAGSDDGKRR